MYGRVAVCAVLLWISTPVKAWQEIKTDELPADTIILLQRGACEHRCPVYKIILFADGSAVFDGRFNVHRAETVRTKVSLEALGKLIADVKESGFFDWKPRYAPGLSGCESPKSDAATVILSVSTEGKAKTIVHYRGCGGAESARLAELEDKIDAAVNSARWVK